MPNFKDVRANFLPDLGQKCQKNLSANPVLSKNEVLNNHGVLTL